METSGDAGFDDERRLTRRGVLSTLGLASIATLAGCGQNRSESTQPGDGEPSPTPDDSPTSTPTDDSATTEEPSANQSATITPSSSDVSEPDQWVHDPTNVVKIAPNVYSFFCSTPTPGLRNHHLRNFVVEMDADDPKWQAQGVWPLTTGENSIPNFNQWMLPWLEEYGYDPSEQSIHTDIACIAPSLYDADTVYFWMNNIPAQEWARENGKEPAMFAALFRATATGGYPNKEWTMEPYPVYYSDDKTAAAGWPRAVDPQVWNDDGEMYMTVGSWDPYGERVIAIAEMNRDTGRLAGLDTETPGYYKNAKSAFHPVTTFGEAAYSFKNGDYYYLFVNVGTCCSGTDSTYAIVVGRSKERYGPYVDHEGRSFMDHYPWPEERNDLETFPGKLLIKTDGRYIGPGHTGIYTHDDGRLEMSFHYYDGDFAGLPKFSTREIDFDDQGWPYVVSDEPFRFA